MQRMGKFNQFRVFSVNWQCPWCHFLPDGCRCYPGAVTGGSLRQPYNRQMYDTAHLQHELRVMTYVKLIRDVF